MPRAIFLSYFQYFGLQSKIFVIECIGIIWSFGVNRLKILKQVTVIFTVCVIGDIISSFLPIPFPGSVLAMIILFFCLLCGAVKTAQVDSIADFFLQNMAFLFIPATVSIIEYLDVLKSVLFQFIFICLITTVITFVCTAYSVKGIIYLMNKRKLKKKGLSDNA